METIEIFAAIEALEEFGFECENFRGQIIVRRGNETLEILASPIPRASIDQLIENAGF
jgi:hypothetical protein